MISTKTRIQQIHKQLQQNKNAFKKNKQNMQILSNRQIRLTQKQSLPNLKQKVNKNIKTLIKQTTNSSQSYELIVKQLKLLLQQAWRKNEFLVKDRTQLMKQNYLLKQNVQKLTTQLNNYKQQLQSYKLNTNQQINGIFQNGNIFNIIQFNQSRFINNQYNSKLFDNSNNSKQIHENNSRLVQEKVNYIIQSTPYQKYSYNQYQNHQANQSKQNKEISLSPPFIDQQSLLLRQVSRQMLKHSYQLNQNMEQSPVLGSSPNASNQSPGIQSKSPALQSQISSQINRTPNYNFKQTPNNNINYKQTTFDIQQLQLNKLSNHYIDVRPGLISYQNSYPGSENISQKNSSKFVSQKRNQQLEVQISLNNINNQLYLPINQNKKILKQQIQTFKQHLNKNASVNQSYQNHKENSQSQNMQVRVSNDYDNVYQSRQQTSTQPAHIYCSLSCEQGIFRAFYLSILQTPYHRYKYLQILSQLQHDQSFQLYSIYPKNQFWIQMIHNFLQFVQGSKLKPQQLLQHINSHKLIDLLLIQSLKYRVAFLYNDVSQQLNQSSLLNGSINNQYNYPNIGNKTNRTNKQSMNISLQNINYNNQQLVTQSVQKSTIILQFFNGLAQAFGLQCKKDQNAYVFYQTQNYQQHGSSQVRTQMGPSFVILTNQQNKTFEFSFEIHYQQSHQQSHQQSQQGYMNRSNQLYNYENSVQKPFEDINLKGLNSQQSRNQNLLNSSSNNSPNCNSHSPNQYIEGRQFISQTNQYQTNNQCQPTNQYEESNSYEEQGSYDLSQIQRKFNMQSQNISYNLYDSKDTTQKSLRTSLNQARNSLLDSYRGQQLRQKLINYNTLSNNYPIQQQLIENQSKSVLYSSFGKSNNLSSISPSPNVSKNASKQVSRQVSRVKEIKQKQLVRPINKGINRYNKEDIFDENYIMRKVNSVASENDDQTQRDDEETPQKGWQLKFKMR